MMKRNDGYALSYVLVVLLVLCTIALSVMTISLNNLKRQQASIDRMADKYAAQGLIEQVVAQLGCEPSIDAVIGKYAAEDDGIEFVKIPESDDYIVTAVFNGTTVTSMFKLNPIETDVSGTTEVTGYAVTYTAYTTEVTP